MSEQVGWRALESQGGHLTRVSKPGPRGKSSVWGWCCPRHVSPICLLLGSGQSLHAGTRATESRASLGVPTSTEQQTKVYWCGHTGQRNKEKAQRGQCLPRQPDRLSDPGNPRWKEETDCPKAVLGSSCAALWHVPPHVHLHTNTRGVCGGGRDRERQTE